MSWLTSHSTSDQEEERRGGVGPAWAGQCSVCDSDMSQVSRWRHGAMCDYHRDNIDNIRNISIGLEMWIVIDTFYGNQCLWHVTPRVSDKCPGPLLTLGAPGGGNPIPVCWLTRRDRSYTGLESIDGGQYKCKSNEWWWEKNEGKHSDPHIALKVLAYLSWRNFQFQIL